MVWWMNIQNSANVQIIPFEPEFLISYHSMIFNLLA